MKFFCVSNFGKIVFNRKGVGRHDTEYTVYKPQGSLVSYWCCFFGNKKPVGRRGREGERKRKNIHVKICTELENFNRSPVSNYRVRGHSWCLMLLRFLFVYISLDKIWADCIEKVKNFWLFSILNLTFVRRRKWFLFFL